MESYDYSVLGLGNSQHPANQEETEGLTIDDALVQLKERCEIEISVVVEDYIFTLEKHIARLENRNRNLKSQLVRLSEIEQSFNTFGSNTYEENQDKNIILTKHQ
jgi:hypothetical protein